MKWGIELSDLVFSTYITQLLKHVQGSFIMECYLVLDVVSNIQQLVQQSVATNNAKHKEQQTSVHKVNPLAEEK